MVTDFAGGTVHQPSHVRRQTDAGHRVGRSAHQDAPQHVLNFFPERQGQRSFRPTFTLGFGGSATILPASPCMMALRWANRSS